MDGQNPQMVAIWILFRSIYYLVFLFCIGRSRVHLLSILRTFLLKICLWTALLFTLVGGVIAHYAGPQTDYFYNRFTTEKSASLILGSSRAAQGIDPQSMKSEDLSELYNFSFTNYNSPYGDCYLEAAKKKFSGTKGGIFILEVNPFILSNYKENMSSEEEIFGECETAPSNMLLMNADPNFEYIARNYVEDFKSLIGVKPRPYAIYLHDSGWLEIEIPHDTAFFRENTVK